MDHRRSKNPLLLPNVLGNPALISTVDALVVGTNVGVTFEKHETGTCFDRVFSGVNTSLGTDYIVRVHAGIDNSTVFTVNNPSARRVVVVDRTTPVTVTSEDAWDALQKLIATSPLSVKCAHVSDNGSFCILFSSNRANYVVCKGDGAKVTVIKVNPLVIRSATIGSIARSRLDHFFVCIVSACDKPPGPTIDNQRYDGLLTLCSVGYDTDKEMSALQVHEHNDGHILVECTVRSLYVHLLVSDYSKVVAHSRIPLTANKLFPSSLIAKEANDDQIETCTLAKYISEPSIFIVSNSKRIHYGVACSTIPNCSSTSDDRCWIEGAIFRDKDGFKPVCENCKKVSKTSNYLLTVVACGTNVITVCHSNLTFVERSSDTKRMNIAIANMPALRKEVGSFFKLQGPNRNKISILLADHTNPTPYLVSDTKYEFPGAYYGQMNTDSDFNPDNPFAGTLPTEDNPDGEKNDPAVLMPSRPKVASIVVPDLINVAITVRYGDAEKTTVTLGPGTYTLPMLASRYKGELHASNEDKLVATNGVTFVVSENTAKKTQPANDWTAASHAQYSIVHCRQHTFECRSRFGSGLGVEQTTRGTTDPKPDTRSALDYALTVLNDGVITTGNTSPRYDEAFKLTMEKLGDSTQAVVPGAPLLASDVSETGYNVFVVNHGIVDVEGGDQKVVQTKSYRRWLPNRMLGDIGPLPKYDGGMSLKMTELQTKYALFWNLSQVWTPPTWVGAEVTYTNIWGHNNVNLRITDLVLPPFQSHCKVLYRFPSVDTHKSIGYVIDDDGPGAPTFLASNVFKLHPRPTLEFVEIKDVNSKDVVAASILALPNMNVYQSPTLSAVPIIAYSLCRTAAEWVAHSHITIEKSGTSYACVTFTREKGIQSLELDLLTHNNMEHYPPPTAPLVGDDGFVIVNKKFIHCITWTGDSKKCEIDVNSVVAVNGNSVVIASDTKAGFTVKVGTVTDATFIKHHVVVSTDCHVACIDVVGASVVVGVFVPAVVASGDPVAVRCRHRDRVDNNQWYMDMYVDKETLAYGGTIKDRDTHEVRAEKNGKAERPAYFKFYVFCIDHVAIRLVAEHEPLKPNPFHGRRPYTARSEQQQHGVHRNTPFDSTVREPKIGDVVMTTDAFVEYKRNISSDLFVDDNTALVFRGETLYRNKKVYGSASGGTYAFSREVRALSSVSIDQCEDGVVKFSWVVTAWQSPPKPGGEHNIVMLPGAAVVVQTFGNGGINPQMHITSAAKQYNKRCRRKPATKFQHYGEEWPLPKATSSDMSVVAQAVDNHKIAVYSLCYKTFQPNNPVGNNCIPFADSSQPSVVIDKLPRLYITVSRCVRANDVRRTFDSVSNLIDATEYTWETTYVNGHNCKDIDTDFKVIDIFVALARTAPVMCTDEDNWETNAVVPMTPKKMHAAMLIVRNDVMDARRHMIAIDEEEKTQTNCVGWEHIVVAYCQPLLYDDDVNHAGLENWGLNYIPQVQDANDVVGGCAAHSVGPDKYRMGVAVLCCADFKPDIDVSSYDLNKIDALSPHELGKNKAVGATVLAGIAVATWGSSVGATLLVKGLFVTYAAVGSYLAKVTDEEQKLQRIAFNSAVLDKYRAKRFKEGEVVHHHERMHSKPYNRATLPTDALFFCPPDDHINVNGIKIKTVLDEHTRSRWNMASLNHLLINRPTHRANFPSCTNVTASSKPAAAGECQSPSNSCLGENATILPPEPMDTIKAKNKLYLVRAWNLGNGVLLNDNGYCFPVGFTPNCDPFAVLSMKITEATTKLKPGDKSLGKLEVLCVTGNGKSTVLVSKDVHIGVLPGRVSSAIPTYFDTKRTQLGTCANGGNPDGEEVYEDNEDGDADRKTAEENLRRDVVAKVKADEKARDTKWESEIAGEIKAETKAASEARAAKVKAEETRKEEAAEEKVRHDAAAKVKADEKARARKETREEGAKVFINTLAEEYKRPANEQTAAGDNPEDPFGGYVIDKIIIDVMQKRNTFNGIAMLYAAVGRQYEYRMQRNLTRECSNHAASHTHIYRSMYTFHERRNSILIKMPGQDTLTGQKTPKTSNDSIKISSNEVASFTNGSVLEDDESIRAWNDFWGLFESGHKAVQVYIGGAWLNGTVDGLSLGVVKGEHGSTTIILNRSPRRFASETIVTIRKDFPSAPTNQIPLYANVTGALPKDKLGFPPLTQMQSVYTVSAGSVPRDYSQITSTWNAKRDDDVDTSHQLTVVDDAERANDSKMRFGVKKPKPADDIGHGTLTNTTVDLIEKDGVKMIQVYPATQTGFANRWSVPVSARCVPELVRLWGCFPVELVFPPTVVTDARCVAPEYISAYDDANESGQDMHDMSIRPSVSPKIGADANMDHWASFYQPVNDHRSTQYNEDVIAIVHSAETATYKRTSQLEENFSIGQNDHIFLKNGYAANLTTKVVPDTSLSVGWSVIRKDAKITITKGGLPQACGRMSHAMADDFNGDGVGLILSRRSAINPKTNLGRSYQFQSTPARNFKNVSLCKIASRLSVDLPPIENLCKQPLNRGLVSNNFGFRLPEFSFLTQSGIEANRIFSKLDEDRSCGCPTRGPIADTFLQPCPIPSPLTKGFEGMFNPFVPITDWVVSAHVPVEPKGNVVQFAVLEEEDERTLEIRSTESLFLLSNSEMIIWDTSSTYTDKTLMVQQCFRMRLVSDLGTMSDARYLEETDEEITPVQVYPFILKLIPKDPTKHRWLPLSDESSSISVSLNVPCTVYKNVVLFDELPEGVYTVEKGRTILNSIEHNGNKRYTDDGNTAYELINTAKTNEDAYTIQMNTGTDARRTFDRFMSNETTTFKLHLFTLSPGMRSVADSKVLTFGCVATQGLFSIGADDVVGALLCPSRKIDKPMFSLGDVWDKSSVAERDWLMNRHNAIYSNGSMHTYTCTQDPSLSTRSTVVTSVVLGRTTVYLNQAGVGVGKKPACFCFDPDNVTSRGLKFSSHDGKVVSPLSDTGGCLTNRAAFTSYDAHTLIAIGNIITSVADLEANPDSQTSINSDTFGKWCAYRLGGYFYPDDKFVSTGLRAILPKPPQPLSPKKKQPPSPYAQVLAVITHLVKAKTCAYVVNDGLRTSWAVQRRGADMVAAVRADRIFDERCSLFSVLQSCPSKYTLISPLTVTLGGGITPTLLNVQGWYTTTARYETVTRIVTSEICKAARSSQVTLEQCIEVEPIALGTACVDQSLILCQTLDYGLHFKDRSALRQSTAQRKQAVFSIVRRLREKGFISSACTPTPIPGVVPFKF